MCMTSFFLLLDSVSLALYPGTTGLLQPCRPFDRLERPSGDLLSLMPTDGEALSGDRAVPYAVARSLSIHAASGFPQFFL